VPLAEAYRLHTVAYGEVSEKVVAEGTVEPKNTVTLYLDAAQTVKEVNIKPGDAVKAGDVLVAYDIEDTVRELSRKREEAVLNHKNAQLVLQGIASPLEGNELLQYQSEVTSAEKNVFDAETDIKSIEVKLTQQQIRVDDALRVRNETERLLESGLATQSAFDSAETAYRNALETQNDLLLQKASREKTLESRETQLADAQSRLANAQNRFFETSTALRYAQQQNAVQLAQLAIDELDDTLAKLTETTVSPITGGVQSVSAVEGATLPKSGIVAMLQDLSEIVVRADVTEFDAPMLSIGQNVSIAPGGLPDAVYTGVVTKIAAAAIEKEKSSGDEVVVPVEIKVQNADERLKAGYSADIEVFLSQTSNVLFVPTQALRYEDDAVYVFVLRDDAAVKTPVTLGLRGDRAAEVSFGLQEGDVVLVDY